MASELNSLATNVKGAGKADLNTKAAKEEHFEQKVTEFTARQAATKGDEKQPRIDTNVRPLFASIRVHSWLEQSSGIRAILNVGTAKITAKHSPNQKGPGKNRE